MKLIRFSCEAHEIEELATQLCRLSGGIFHRKGTHRNLWRRRAEALIHLANGDEAKAEEAMKRRIR